MRVRVYALVLALFAGLAIPLAQTTPPPLPTNLRIIKAGDVPLPPATSPHGYFEQLRSFSSHVVSYSLRSQAQLDQYSKNGTPTSVHVTYRPELDTYWDKQDAAKVRIPPGTTNLDQVRFPINASSGDAWVIWDVYWGKEFKDNRGLINVNKTFMVAGPCSSGPMMELNVTYTYGGPTLIGRLGGRHYLYCNGTTGGITSTTPLEPRDVAHDIVPNLWYRFIWRFTFGGTRIVYSAWFGNERQDAIQYYSGLRLDSNLRALTEFWLEWNTSQSGSQSGERIGYVRGVQLQRNPTTEQQQAILSQRPMR